MDFRLALPRRAFQPPRGDPGCASKAGRLPTVAMPLEVEEELRDAALEAALEAPLVAEIPLAVDHLERDVLVGRTAADAQDAHVSRALWVGLHHVRGCLGAVDQVWVEDVELVPLHHFGRRVVLVPLVARVHAVEVLRLARPVAVVPPSHLLLERHLEREARLPLLEALARLCVHRRQRRRVLARAARAAAAAATARRATTQQLDVASLDLLGGLRQR